MTISSENRVMTFVSFEAIQFDGTNAVDIVDYVTNITGSYRGLSENSGDLYLEVYLSKDISTSPMPTPALRHAKVSVGDYVIVPKLGSSYDMGVIISTEADLTNNSIEI